MQSPLFICFFIFISLLIVVQFDIKQHSPLTYKDNYFVFKTTTTNTNISVFNFEIGIFLILVI